MNLLSTSKLQLVHLDSVGSIYFAKHKDMLLSPTLDIVTLILLFIRD